MWVTTDAPLPEGAYRSLFEDSPLAMSVLDTDGRQIASNRAFARLMGVEPGALAGEAIRSITRDADRSWTQDFLGRLARGEVEEYRTEKVYVRPDGHPVRCRLVSRPVRRDGEVVAIAGIIEPIDARPVVSDARMRKLIEHIDDTVTLIDEQGNLLDTSGRYRPTLGYPAEFWATRTIFDLLHPDDAERVLGMREDVLSAPGMHVFGEFRVRSADGSYQQIEVHAVNLLHDPDVSGIVITSRNISVRNEMLAEVAKRRDEAVANAELRSRMVATVSHELRNPLHAMSGLAELIATSPPSSEMRQLAEALHRQILDLSHVIDDLLDNSRLEIGVISLNPKPVELRAVMDDIIMLSRSMIGSRPLNITGSVDPAVPRAVSLDPTRLRQLLSNLVGNAMKYTDHGQVHVQVRVQGDELALEVSDTGRGIPEAELSTIFEPFSTASTGGQQVGAGLGLSIVRQIVALMGGTTSVTSSVGRGSTFTVTMPLVPADLTDEVHQPRGITGGTVLVVEDNPVNQMLARSQLERLGMTATIVGSGEDALAHIHAGHPASIVLMDHQLPGMDGLQCARAIRDWEEATGADRSVIIGVTASAMATDRDQCLMGGMDDFLAKPVSLSDLRQTLERWVGATDHPTAVSTATDRSEDVSHVSEPALDPGTLDRLAEDLGGTDTVTALARTYLDELPRRQQALRDGSATNDAAAMARAAHAMKSSSRMLGGRLLGDVCHDLERSTDPNVSRRLVEAVLAESERFAGALRVWVTAHP